MLTAPQFTPRPLQEEIANSITHGAGFVLATIATTVVIVTSGFHSRTSALAFVVYAATLLAVYAVSTFSHLVRRPRLKYVLRVWDQGLIYLLIAGTYTPFVVAYLPSPQRYWLLACIWGLALFGFAAKTYLQHRINRFNAYSYVALGWIPALVMAPVIDLACFGWMMAGGVSYTVGTQFLKLDRTHTYFHAIWHTLVIVGSACHFFAVVRFAV